MKYDKIEMLFLIDFGSFNGTWSFTSILIKNIMFDALLIISHMNALKRSVVLEKLKRKVHPIEDFWMVVTKKLVASDLNKKLNAVNKKNKIKK